MKFIIKTQVRQPLEKVKNGFNESLFLKLSPPFPKVELTQFDGSDVGDIVSLKLNFLLFKQSWVSKITDSKETENEYYFIDEGVVLPTGFKYWRHKHILKSIDGQTEIIDEVEYKSNNSILTLLLKPILLSQFFYRKPIYKRIFG